MANIADLRKRFPDKSDSELVFEYGRVTGSDPELAAYDLGLDPAAYRQDDPGFATAAQNSLYSSLGAVGQIAQDVTGGRVGRGLEEYADLGQYRNPVTLTQGDSDSAFQNVISNFAEDPLGSFAQAGGMAAGFMGPQAGAKLGLRGYQAMRGIQAAAGAPSALSTTGAAAYYGLPSYGGIRDNQELLGENGAEDKFAAATGALTVGAIESRFGPEAWLSRGLGAGIGGAGKNFVRTGLKTGMIEGAEEMAQTPVEVAASYGDVFSLDTLDQMAAGGVVGLAAGAPMGMAAHPFMPKKGEAPKPPLPATEERDLLGGPLQGDLLTGNYAPAPQYEELQPDEPMGPSPVAADPYARDLSGQMSFLDDMYRQGDSPTNFDQTVAADPYYGLDAEARDFENRQGGVSGYRAALQGAPGTFENITPNRDFAIPGARQYGAVEQTPEEFMAEQGMAAPTAPQPATPAAPQEFQSKRQNELWNRALAEVTDEANLGGINQAISERKFKRAEKLIEEAKAEAAYEASLPPASTPAAIAGVSPVAETQQGLFTPPALPARDAAPEQVQDYRAQLKNYLTGQLKPEELRVLQVAEGADTAQAFTNEEVSQLRADLEAEQKQRTGKVDKARVERQLEAILTGTEADNPSSLRVAAKELGLSHEGVRKRRNKALARVDELASQAGVPAEVAREMLGVVPEQALEIAPVSEAAVAQMGGMSYRRGDGPRVGNNIPDADEYDPTAGFDRNYEANPTIDAEGNETGGYDITVDERADEAGLDDIAVEEAAATVEEEIGLEGVRPSANGLTLEDAANEWNDARVPAHGDPMWDELSVAQKAEWANAFYRWDEGVEGTSDQLLETNRKRIANGTQRSAEKTDAGVGRAAEKAGVQVPEGRAQNADQQDPGQQPARGAEEGAVPAAGAADQVERNPLEVRAEKIREVAGPKQIARLEKLIARFQNREIDVERLSDELSILEMQAFPKERGGEGVRFSKAQGREGQDAAGIRERMRKLFFNPKNFDSRVKVVQSEAELPAQYQASQDNTTVMGFYDTRTGVTYLIADNIPPGRELGVFLHEVGGHMGMRDLLGKANFDALYNQINDWAQGDGKQENAIAKAAIDRVLNAGATAPAEVKEETIAYFIEEAVNAGIDPSALASAPKGMQAWFLRLWNAVKAAVRKLGLNPESLSAQDVVDMAYGAAKLQLNASQMDIDAANDATGRPATEPAFVDNGVYNSIAAARETAVKAAAQIDFGNRWDATTPKLMTLHQLKDWYGDKLETLTKYVKNFDLMAMAQQRIMQDGHKVTQQWVELKKPVMQALHGVMLDATLQGVHPDLPLAHDDNAHLGNTPEAQAKHAALAARYNALPQEAKDVYQSAKAQLAQNWEKRKALFADVATAAYQKRIDERRASGDEKEAMRLEKKRDAEIKAHDEKIKSIKGPYFPLMRFGDYVVVSRSAGLQAAEAALEDATGDEATELKKRISELRKDGKHYRAEAYQSSVVAKRRAEELAGQGFTTEAFKADQFNAQFRPFAASGLEHIEHMVDASFGGNAQDRAAASKIKDLMTEVYISTLPEHAALQRQLKREGIEGASDDMLRAFGETMEKDAFFLSRMEYSKELADNMFHLKRESRKAGIKYQHVYDNLQQRVSLDFTYTRTPVQDILSKASGVFHLGIAPAFLLTNMTQPWMITVPQLAGKYGIGRVTGAMRNAWVDAGKIIAAGKGGVLNLKDLDFSKLEAGDERDMLQYIADLGQLDITQTADMGLLAEGMSPKYYKAMKAFNWATHHIEMHNRVVTALAAYRLAMAKEGDVQKAREAAYDAVVRTQLDYSGTNAAYFMKQGVGPLGGMNKLVYQFRKYQQGMIYLLARNAKLAFAGDKEAMKSLSYLMGMQIAFAGAAGIPLMAPILGLMALGFDDDDEDGDPETWLRNQAADLFGADAARAFFRGLPTMLGVDVSNNLGMGGLFKPLPMLRTEDVTDARTGKEALGAMAAQIPGAWTGMLTGAYDAMAKGDLAPALPRFARNVVKAHDYATEGLQTRNKAQVIEANEFDGWDLAYRALGFSTTKESEYYSAKQGKENTSRAIKDRRDALLRDYASAKLRGEDVAEIQAQIQEFNTEHPDKGFRIDRSSLIRSVNARKRDASTKDDANVTFRRNEAALEEITRFAR